MDHVVGKGFLRRMPELFQKHLAQSNVGYLIGRADVVDLTDLPSVKDGIESVHDVSGIQVTPGVVSIPMEHYLLAALQ